MAIPNWATEIGEVRERLARLEAHAAMQDKVAEQRHQQILSTLKELEHRAVDSDKRHWRLTAGLIALAVGGGAGAAQLLRGLLGG